MMKPGGISDFSAIAVSDWDCRAAVIAGMTSSDLRARRQVACGDRQEAGTGAGYGEHR
jgi:hypothetical protein